MQEHWHEKDDERAGDSRGDNKVVETLAARGPAFHGFGDSVVHVAVGSERSAAMGWLHAASTPTIS